jgi:hypothetical protein
MAGRTVSCRKQLETRFQEEEEEKGGEGEMLGKPASQISPHAARRTLLH